MHFPSLIPVLSALALLLLVSENTLYVTAAPLLQSASDSSDLKTYGLASVGPRSSIEETQVVKRGRARTTPKVTSSKLTASDLKILKSSNYRKIALANNDGAYVKTAGGSQVKWQKGANGEAFKQFNQST